MPPTEWEPLYPAFADTGRAAGRSSGVSDPTDTGGSSVEWVRSPDTSHTWGFRYWDAREHRFLRLLFPGESHLEVRFKPSGRKTTYSDYRYVFADPAQGERVFKLMQEADHPGEVVHKELIQAGIPYYPVSLD